MANERQQTINIAYGGYTATPSDYESADGDLAACIGMVNEDGGLKGVFPPKVCIKPMLYVKGASCPLTVCFVHKNSDWLHYIGYAYDEGKQNLYLGWLDFDSEAGWAATDSTRWECFRTFGSDGSETALAMEGETFADVSAVGNVLIVSTDKHIHYFLYGRVELGDGSSIVTYKHLGTEVPKIQMEFALNGEFLGKYFDDLSLTLSDVVSAEGGWTIRKNVTASLGKNATVSVSVKLEKDTRYRIRLGEKDNLTYQSGNWQWTIYFVTASGQKDLASFKRIDDDTPQEFEPWRDYVSIEMACPALNVETHTLIVERYAIGTAIGSALKNTEENYTAVMGVINSYVNNFATEKNRHIYPFFIRYAVKMYDGSYLHISPPILMIPNSGYAPYMIYTQAKKIQAFAFVADVQAKLGNLPDNIGDWKDLIMGVDLFFSQPVFCYKQGKSFSKYETPFTYNSGNTSVGYLEASYNGIAINTGSYKYLVLKDAAEKYASLENLQGAIAIEIAPISETEAKTKIRSISTFYHVKSYSMTDLENFGGDYSTVELEEGALSNLVARTALSDEILSGRTFVKGSTYSYNKRTHLYGAQYRLPYPSAIQQTNQRVQRVTGAGKVTDVWVLVRTSESTKCVHQAVDFDYLDDTGMVWYFYPDNRAYAMYMRIVQYFGDELVGEFYQKRTLTQHETLNGAYWLNDSLNLYNSNMTNGSKDEIPVVDDCMEAATSIYVSEVNNPFAFSSENVVSIDATRIIGLCTAAKAMSTGQFGQFPLYVFTDNGVWAMELASTGVYKATQPITRDVCVNAESITQLDGEVLFATDRGIMDLSGSTSLCLSDTLEAEKQFVLTDLMTEEQAKALLGYVNTGGGTEITLESQKALGAVSFLAFIRTCRMVYDYIHQRVIVYSPGYGYAYVYSIKGKSWGMIRSDLSNSLNSYPEALAMDADGNLVDFSLSDATGINGLVVTRPLKLGLQDIHKTVDTIIQRGYFKRGHVGQLLYGSNNLFDWKGIWNSADEYLRGFSGEPYKYFRLVLVCKLGKDESISGFTARFEPRLANRPR